MRTASTNDCIVAVYAWARKTIVGLRPSYFRWMRVPMRSTNDPATVKLEPIGLVHGGEPRSRAGRSPGRLCLNGRRRRPRPLVPTCDQRKSASWWAPAGRLRTSSETSGSPCKVPSPLGTSSVVVVGTPRRHDVGRQLRVEGSFRCLRDLPVRVAASLSVELRHRYHSVMRATLSCWWRGSL